MKSILMYEYNLKNPIIKDKKEYFYIKDNNNLMILKKTTHLDEQLLDSTQKEKFNRLIKNRNNSYITNINGKNYILYIIDRKENIVIEQILSKRLEFDEARDWKTLWLSKMNMLVANKEKIKNMLLNEAFDYYIGLLKNAIYILNYNNIDLSTNKLMLCHIRVNEKLIKCPENSVKDYKERDIAEYMKYLFYEKKIPLEDIVVEESKIKNNNKILVLARLLFPSNYIDLVEKNINNEYINDNKIKELLNRAKEYEELLSLFMQRNNLEINIEWLKAK